ncbi:hypothetical protein [Vannielia litorea]|uniref:hypothetical protein n=1 Tax=Vannielia litorea TaxID=1217970 RepID=UPI001C959C20|nr:hypothetical protein [Vannielia litorea]MBY6046460.1 hypothetical protein [Vannielia litorea]MBY6073873.1 hypothetical protein [Vannielia litorea]
MTPDFALDLSLDGISLLRRAEDGWRRVGAVSLDADRLSDDLAALRAQAGGAVATKLVIPNGQILYTTCPASGRDELADEVRVRAALVGATPYEVSDLLFDWESDGETLHIAVVARETLEEARAFAAEHGFGPVGYVAVPPRGAFLREPFFGPVDRGPGAGPVMLADAEPIEVVGDWEEPAAVAAEPVEVEAEAEAAADAEGVAEVAEGAPEEAIAEGAETLEVAEEAAPVVDEVAEPETVEPELAEIEEVNAVAEEAAPEVVEAAGDEAPTEADAPALEDEDSGVEAAAPEEVAAPEEEALSENEPAEDEPEAPAAAMPAFSSIRAQTPEGQAPRLGAARSDAASGAVRKLGGATRGKAENTVAKPDAAAKPEPQEKPAAKVVAKPAETAARTIAAMTPEAADGTPAAKPDPELAPQDASPRSKAAFAAFRDKVGTLRRKPEGGSALTPEIIAAPLPKPTPDDLPKRLSQEATAGDMTIFGARGKAKPKQRKGFPIGLTLGLVLFLGMVGLWSKLFIAGGDTDGAPVVAEQSVAGTLPLLGRNTGADGALTRSITFSETGTSGATTEPEGEAELAEALQAPAPTDPAMEGEAQMASLADDPFSALPEEEPRIAEPMLENPPLPEIDADAEPAEDELADMEPEPEATPAAPLSPEEAQAAYAESGIWQQAPQPASLPAEESTDDIYIASIDPAVTGYDAVALPRAETGSGSDAALPRQPSPMPPGQDVEFDADGSIRPTQEGVVTAGGVTLYAGRPHVVPRVRPGTAQEASAEAQAETEAETAGETEADSALAGLRPKARPEGLIEENEKATLGGRTRAELAGLRPKARPQSVQDEAESARQAAIEQAVRDSESESAELAADEERAAAEAQARAEAELQNASRLAVAASRKPAAKPRNFGNKVAAARKKAEEEAEAQARAAAAAAARSTTAPQADSGSTQTATAAVVLPRNQRVAPSVPSSASVAKAATDRNVLKLRDINLIGVFGSPSQRRALVRLPSGRLIKVKAGDRLDGGKVAAIGQNELRYVKRGKNITLAMPSG